MLVHDDIPRVKWRLAVVEDIIAGEDGLIRAANIRTSTGKSNRPVTKLYPLEVTASEPTPLPKISSLHPKENVHRRARSQSPCRLKEDQFVEQHSEEENESKNGPSHFVPPRRMWRTVMTINELMYLNYDCVIV